MAYCSSCGNPLDADARFCNKCGASVVPSGPVQPVFEQQAVSYGAPARPVAQVKDKVLGFVGMGLTIFGLFLALLGMLYTLIGMMEPGLAFAFAIAFGFFTMPLGCAGRSMCRNSAANGNTSGACTAGSGMGLATIILSCVMFFLGFVSILGGW